MAKRAPGPEGNGKKPAASTTKKAGPPKPATPKAKAAKPPTAAVKKKAKAASPAPVKQKKVRKKKDPPRLFARWGIFDAGMKQVAIFDYNQRAAAEDKLADLSSKRKTPYFLQIVKEARAVPAPEEAPAT